MNEIKEEKEILEMTDFKSINGLDEDNQVTAILGYRHGYQLAIMTKLLDQRQIVFSLRSPNKEYEEDTEFKLEDVCPIFKIINTGYEIFYMLDCNGNIMRVNLREEKMEVVD